MQNLRDIRLFIVLALLLMNVVLAVLVNAVRSQPASIFNHLSGLVEIGGCVYRE